VLRRYAFEGGAFKRLSSQYFGKNKTAAFWVDGAVLWTVEKAGELAGGFELKRYSLKIYN
jgi:hypothetical protein